MGRIIKHAIVIITLVSLCIACCDKGDIQVDDEGRLVAKWHLERVTGGLHGNGYNPGFEYLEFLNDHFCQWYGADNEILAAGRYEIRSLDMGEYTGLIHFKVSQDSLINHFVKIDKKYRFEGRDTLLMDEGCCDLFSYVFSRVP